MSDRMDSPRVAAAIRAIEARYRVQEIDSMRSIRGMGCWPGWDRWPAMLPSGRCDTWWLKRERLRNYNARNYKHSAPQSSAVVTRRAGESDFSAILAVQDWRIVKDAPLACRIWCSYSTFPSARIDTEWSCPVREHFASPLLQFADDDKGQTFILVEHPGMPLPSCVSLLYICFIGGTGSLISALQNNQVDVVMYVLFISFLHVPCIERAVLWHFSALTDPLIAGIARGSDAYKLVGSYVATPLNWYACSILQWPPPPLLTISRSGRLSPGRIQSTSPFRI